MLFLTTHSLSARPRRRLVLGRDEEIDPISPNEIDDLVEANDAEALTANSVFPEGRCEGEVLRRNTVRGPDGVESD